MKFQLFILFSITSLCFQVCFKAHAETIPYKNLIGVWTMSQGGPNHDLTHGQVEDLCGMAVLLFHPDRNLGIHMRWQQDDKLMMSMDVLSKAPCTYADNQLTCHMETTAIGKSLGDEPWSFRFEKVREGVYDAATLKPDGQTVDKVQTAYRCPLTIPEAQAWLEANSGLGEIGEKMDEALGLLEKAAPQFLEKAVESLPELNQKIESDIESNNKKIELLKKNAQSGEGKALAGLGILKLMSTVIPTGVGNDPEGGLSMLKVAAEKQAVPAYVMLATVNMLAMANLKQDFGTAAGWLEKAVVEQRADARNALGMLKLFGLGVEQDGEEAVQLLTLSAQQGNASAHFNLGIIHVFYPEDLMQKLGISLEQSLTKGMMHLKIASEIANSLDQLHENSVQVWNYLSRHKHPELLKPSRDLSRKWAKEHRRKFNKSNVLLKIHRLKYPDVTLQMYFKLEGGQVKLLESHINSKLEGALF